MRAETGTRVSGFRAYANGPGRVAIDESDRAAFDAGINVFDVGPRRYYRDAEKNLAPFVKQVRDEIFLISKAMVYLDVEPNETISLVQSKQAAQTWSSLLDDSLRDLDQDHVDAYYVMGVHNPHIVASDEIYEAFERAKQAGKVTHLGLSTHQNAERVLEAAMRTGHYDLAQVAITPAGWYDWEDKGIARDTQPMADLVPYLESVRAAGIALKASRPVCGLWATQPSSGTVKVVPAASTASQVSEPWLR